LTHKKLNNLVYVNYNLRLRLKEVSGPSHDEGDFIDHLAHLSFYDEHHLVREWFEYGRSNQEPVLDEDDDDGDVPLPSHLVSDHVDPSDLRETTVMIASVIGHVEWWETLTLGRGSFRRGLRRVTEASTRTGTNKRKS
jgi:hypothetical protein